MVERPAARGPLRLVAAIGAFVIIAGVAAREWAAQGAAGEAVRLMLAGRSGHPAALRDQLLLDSALAARRGGQLDAAALDRLGRLARHAPLASEPFLLSGAAAQTAGDWQRAETLYRAARSRDPGSAAARYLLADLYLRTGRPSAGLVELLALGRLKPRAIRAIEPGLADYARQPGAVAILAPLAASHPSLFHGVLMKLAEDPANAALVLKVAPRRAPDEPFRLWEVRLIEGLVASGQFARAEALWRTVAGRPRDGLVHDPAFARRQPLAPFDWAFYVGPAGVVEQAGAGGLDLFHYGREPMTAARQLIRLPAGRYRLHGTIVPRSGGAGLTWRIGCVDGKTEVAQLAAGREAMFAVPPGCPAQWLSLEAAASEPPQSLEARVKDVRIERAVPR